MLSKKQERLIVKEVSHIKIAQNIAMQWEADQSLNNFDLNGKPTNITEGYMVAFKGGSILNKVKEQDFYDFNELVQAIVKLLDMNLHLGYIGYIGFWENEGKLYIDLSVNILLINSALTFGHMQDQEAIWDCLRSRAIKVADHSY